jgi:glycosyltransferase involved in cell wall biosynthesis
VEIISQLSPLDLVSCADVAAALAENHAVGPPRPRLLVDVSRLIHYDAKSGIQRVVKNTLKALLSRPCDLRVEPVYRDGDVYRYARHFTCDFLNVSPLNLKDGIVDFHPSDTFLGLDLDIEITEGASAALRTLRSRGGTVNFVVYDLLVLTRPVSFSGSTITAFHNWFQRTIDAATRFIAISRTVADDLYAMLADTKRNRSEIQVSWYHLGTDLGGDETHRPGATGERAKILSHLAARTSFLTVGTIEPRKGIAQLLDAAEDVWRDHDVVFMLAGNGGWLVDDLLDRIKKHPQLNKRLFWFGQVTDDLLLDLYRTATAVVLPSEAEGFGLPLIEAAQLNIPVIARDIPVFREVGREGAYYFHGQSGAELASSLRDWLEQYRRHAIPDPRRVDGLDWAQSTDQLLAAVQGNRPYRIWRNAD